MTLLVVLYFSVGVRHATITISNVSKATITWCDLLSRLFCNCATLLSKFESDKV